MQKRLQLFALTIIFGLGATSTKAQEGIRFEPHEELNPASQIALDSLGQEPILVAIGTLGDASQLGFPHSHDYKIQDGKSGVWTYTFASSEGSGFGVGAFRTGTEAEFFNQRFDGFFFPEELDLSGEYVESSKAATHVRENSVFQDYQMSYPDHIVEDVVLLWPSQNLISILPEGFPADKPAWIFSWNTALGRVDNEISRPLLARFPPLYVDYSHTMRCIA